MTVLIIDGQGGNLGRQLIRATRERFPEHEVIAVGTNALATSNMLKSNPHKAATGENAVVVACRRADVILGPVGIVIADALLGEVTPKMAVAVGQSEGVRILIPMSRCGTRIAGVEDCSTGELIDGALKQLEALSKAD